MCRRQVWLRECVVVCGVEIEIRTPADEALFAVCTRLLE